MMSRVPVVYMAFDLLYEQGHSLLGLPYSERRRRLEALPGPSIRRMLPLPNRRRASSIRGIVDLVVG